MRALKWSLDDQCLSSFGRADPAPAVEVGRRRRRRRRVEKFE